MPLVQKIKTGLVWTKNKVVVGLKKLPYSPFSDGLVGAQRIRRGLGYGALAATAIYFGVIGPTRDLYPYGKEPQRQPTTIATSTSMPAGRIPFDKPLLIGRALFDRQMDLINLDVVNGTVTFDAYSVKETDDCQRRFPQPGVSLPDFLRQYKSDCAETNVSITMPFLKSGEVDQIRENLRQYTTVVLEQPTSQTNVYPVAVGPRSTVDFSVVGRQTPYGFEVVADKNKVRFLDGLSSEVTEQVPFRQMEILPTVQDRQRK